MAFGFLKDGFNAVKNSPFGNFDNPLKNPLFYTGIGTAAVGGGALAKRAFSNKKTEIPYQGELDANLGQLDQFINQVGSMQADPGMLQAGREQARQSGALRGLEGPLSAGLEDDAVGQMQSAHEAYRRDKLAGLLGMRGEMLQDFRNTQFGVNQLDKARQLQKWQSILGLLGGAAGSPGGPAGAKFGMDAGQLGAGLFF